MPLHIHPSVRQERDSLGFQQTSLQIRVHSHSDGAVTADHPMPRKTDRASTHGPANLTGGLGSAQHPGDMAVAQHRTGGDPGYDLIDLLIKSHLERINRMPRVPGPQ